MKGDSKVIEVLSQCLKAELTAINQYFLHSEMCENWGYERLSKLIKKESIEEMVHAEKLIERILYLDGSPNIDVGDNQSQYTQASIDTVAEFRVLQSGFSAEYGRNSGVVVRSATMLRAEHAAIGRERYGIEPGRGLRFRFP